MGSGIEESSKRRTVSWRGGTGTRRRAAGYDAKSDKGKGGGGAAVLIPLSTNAEATW